MNMLVCPKCESMNVSLEHPFNRIKCDDCKHYASYVDEWKETIVR